MQAWERVQIARHSERPTTLDYIEYLFTDFLEMHGDRFMETMRRSLLELLSIKGDRLLLLAINEARTRRKTYAATLGCHIRKDTEKRCA